MSAPPITALIADDEPHLRDYLQTRLARLWPQLRIVATAGNGVEALQQIRQWQPDIVFLDIKMPGLTGLQVAQQAENCHCVFVTAYDQYALRAFEQAAVDYLLPFTAEFWSASAVDAQAALAGVDVPALRAAWERAVDAALQEATLKRPPAVDGYVPQGKQGVHSEHLSYLLADMQSLARAHPGAVW